MDYSTVVSKAIGAYEALKDNLARAEHVAKMLQDLDPTTEGKQFFKHLKNAKGFEDDYGNMIQVLQVDQISVLVEHARVNGALNGRLYTDIIQAYLNSNRTAMAGQEFLQMSAAGHALGRRILGTLFKELEDKGDYQLLLRVAKASPEDLMTLTAVLTCSAHLELPQEADRALKRMGALRLRINKQFLFDLINSYAGGGYPEKAQALLDIWQANPGSVSAPPSTRDYNVTLGCYLEQKKVQRAKGLLQKMMTAGINANSHILATIFMKAPDREDALEMVRITSHPCIKVLEQPLPHVPAEVQAAIRHEPVLKDRHRLLDSIIHYLQTGAPGDQRRAGVVWDAGVSQSVFGIFSWYSSSTVVKMNLHNLSVPTALVAVCRSLPLLRSIQTWQDLHIITGQGLHRTPPSPSPLRAAVTSMLKNALFPVEDNGPNPTNAIYRHHFDFNVSH